MSTLPSLVLLAIFLASAVAIWVAGIQLSDYTDVLAERLHLGAALGGVILLAIATNLPEIAITASAALAHQLDVAVGNILGGIALQTVVLVALDAAGVRPRKPLTYLAASLTLLLEGALLVTLVAGVLIERSGEEFFRRLGMSGVLFGATALAAATALPELSTGLTSTRLGDYQLAISDIFGGNAFLPVLLLLATVLSGQAVLPRAHNTDIYLTALGALLTVAYMLGLVFRPQRQWLRLGPDSIAVLILYAAGIAGLAFIPT